MEAARGLDRLVAGARQNCADQAAYLRVVVHDQNCLVFASVFRGHSRSSQLFSLYSSGAGFATGCGAAKWGGGSRLRRLPGGSRLDPRREERLYCARDLILEEGRGVHGLGVWSLVLVAGALRVAAGRAGDAPAWVQDSTAALQKELIGRYGEAERGRLVRGLKQAGEFWRARTVTAPRLKTSCGTISPGTRRRSTRSSAGRRPSSNNSTAHMLEVVRAFRTQTDLDWAPSCPTMKPSRATTHRRNTGDDLFANKLAFVGTAQLSRSPRSTSGWRRAATGRGASGRRRVWPSVSRGRVPASVNLAIAEAVAQSEQYIAGYNIWMHHLLTRAASVPFPPHMRLLSHWNLRDQIKADYAEKDVCRASARSRASWNPSFRQTIPKAVVTTRPSIGALHDQVQPSAVKDYESAPTARPGTSPPRRSPIRAMRCSWPGSRR